MLQRSGSQSHATPDLDGRQEGLKAVRHRRLNRPLSFVAVAATMLSAAIPGTAGAQDVPRPDSFTLANGLQFVVIPDRRTPVVTHMIWYKVGSADETPGKSGLAHFLEHLMFKARRSASRANSPRWCNASAVTRTPRRRTDYTNYFQRGPRDKLATLMEYEADRMTGLTLKDSEVLPERDVVLEEYNMRVANSPDARLSEQISAALYLNHPYGRPVIGWRHEIEQLNREDALAFYKRFYAPNNAIVVIAGDVATEEVRVLAEEFYGPLVARPSIPAKRMRPQEPVPISPRTVTFADPRVAIRN